MTNRGDAPALVIIGGSNSLLRDGWVDSLKRLHPDPERIVNLSIGAATTAMGLFRLLSSAELPKDPVIIWEYSLNESNYFTFGQSPELLLRHTSWLFEICARRGYRVLPVILYNRHEAKRRHRNLYRRRLTRLLNGRKLAPLDANDVLRRKFAHISTQDLYSDDAHYSSKTGFTDALAEHALKALSERPRKRRSRLIRLWHRLTGERVAASASVPRRDPSGRFFGQDLRIVTPASSTPRPFENRILSCDLFSLSDDLQIPVKGRPLACFLISSKTGPAISLRSETETRGPYSTRISSQEGGPPRQLKHLFLWSPAQPPLQVDGQLTITPEDMGAQKPIIQHTMAWAENPDGTRDVLNGLIGLLVETDD